MSDQTVDQLSEGDRNPKDAHCIKCESLLLKANSGVYTSHEKQLPVIPTSPEEVDKTEIVSRFYLVEDIFTFENMGFSKNVDQEKFLACADCESGPLGYHDLTTKKSYLAIERVQFK